MRTWKKLALALLLLAAALVAASYLLVDPAARRLVERQGSAALGVATELGSASVRPFAGRVAIDDLSVANPPGFEAAHLLEVDGGHLEVDLRSLLADEVHAGRLELSGVRLSIERGAAGTNVRAVLENLEESGGGAREKTFVVDELLLRDVEVEISVALPGAAPLRRHVALPEIRLEDVGEHSKGRTLSQLVGIVLEAVLRSALENAGDLFPAELLGDLRSAVEELGTGAVERGKEALGEAAERVREGLGGILEGDER